MGCRDVKITPAALWEHVGGGRMGVRKGDLLGYKLSFVDALKSKPPRSIVVT